MLALRKGDKYVSEIAKELGATYAHTFNLVKGMERLEIVRTEKKGRIKYVKLTQKGIELSSILVQFLELLVVPASKFKRKEKAGIKTKRKIIESEPTRMAKTITNMRLQSYIEAMQILHIKLKSERRRKKLPNYARVIGRYRALIMKQRPRDQDGKNLKAKAIALVDELSSELKGKKS